MMSVKKLLRSESEFLTLENFAFEIGRFRKILDVKHFFKTIYLLVSSVGFRSLPDARADYIKEDWQAYLWICRSGLKSVIHGPVELRIRQI